jgi:Lrp/AsnC family transcriptional regulator for asnA, asnC and gidA
MKMVCEKLINSADDYINGVQMPLAYVLAKIEAGQDKQVFETIRKLAGVAAINLTYGIYDLHVEIKVDRMEELDEFIFDKIRKVSGIKETVTLVVSSKGI